VFGIAVETWWQKINPPWRVANGKLLKNRDGDWSAVDIPGKNGFLNVLICLKWWHDAARGKPGREWTEMVKDVGDVLEQILG
jgi:hypothetical protein